MLNRYEGFSMNYHHDYTPFEIGDAFRVVPPGTPAAGDGRLDLVIAKGAFGSGEHETTASCLELLRTLPLEGARVLDVGSGTAILAIAALKLGAASALCVDISEQAIETGRRNCALNGVEERARHFCGFLHDAPTESYDLILANIYGDLLLDLSGEIFSRAAPGGHLLFSGMLWEYNFDVRKRYEGLGCRVLINRMLPDFSTLVLRRAIDNDVPLVTQSAALLAPTGT
ncbi:50S ribosomal protein L11 methyltransferase [Geoalkalibacter halelectricus]|uniref:50S ribosomal protein L11 methyltransferase n=1 Tax=Geoalkalibacter halelectricus TaxID=2847045 RepID=UPI003D212B8E